MVSEIELYTLPKLLIRKRYYVLFLIPAFIVQVTKLVQFTQYTTFSKIPPSTSMHFATCVRTRRVARLGASCRSFMRAITSITSLSSSSHVSTFLPYTLAFIKPHKQKPNEVRSGDPGGQLMVLPRPSHRVGRV
jgi:hypothetical protein